MTAGPAVRRAVVADAWAIAVVHVAAWRAAYAGLLDRAVLDGLSVDGRAARWAGILAEPEPGNRITVAERDGRVVGWCACGPRRDDESLHQGEVRGLYAHPDAWGTGTGAALLADGLAHLDRHWPQSVVWTLVGNDRAVAAYERSGFEAAGVVAPFDGHPGVWQQLLVRGAR